MLQHLAYQYAKKGARLALVARREQLLEEVANRAGELGSPHVLMIIADVQKVDDCSRLVEETIGHFGRCKWINFCSLSHFLVIIIDMRRVFFGIVRDYMVMQWITLSIVLVSCPCPC